MPAEKAVGLIVRTVDYSDTSRIATIWTRELGKVRVLAKGGRRLKSSFDSALDLMTVCSIVLLRKSSGGLDLLTEAQVVERFGQLRRDLAALYAAYYVAELLGDWTEDYDPHPNLFDEAVETLRTLGTPEVPTPLRLLRFEAVLLKELGYAPLLEVCAGCRRPLPLGPELTFSSAAGGMVCGECRVSRRGLVTLTRASWEALKALGDANAWRNLTPLYAGSGATRAQATSEKAVDPVAPALVAGRQISGVRAELRQLFNQYVTHLLGRRPRTMAYLGC